MNELHRDNNTPSRTLVERYRASLDDPREQASIALVHSRGGEDELALGLEYADSDDPLDRVVGARVLAQLDLSPGPQLERAVGELCRLLADVDEDVVHAAAVGLGFQGAAGALPLLLRLVTDARAEVRLGVVHGLSGLVRPDATRALLALSSDPNQEVRNWATFTLGSIVTEDSQEIRAALRANLDDPDHEIRGQALVGLAERKDPEIVALLRREWSSFPDLSMLSLDAACLAASPDLVVDLERLAEEVPLEHDANFKAAFDEAINACRAARAG